jgi:hypothetical protein
MASDFLQEKASKLEGTKNGSDREIPMNKTCLSAFEALYKRRPHDGRVFQSKFGQVLNDSTLLSGRLDASMSEPMKKALFFISYARNDADYEPDRMQMKRFVEDLSVRVARILGVSREGICYFDEGSIQTGTFWHSHLSEAAGTIPVAVTLYSPSYFASPWCGKEFAVFNSRAHFDPAAPKVPSGIVPVRWMNCRSLPSVAAAIQYSHDAFPSEYIEVGLERLLTLKVYGDCYQLSVDAIANSVVSSMQPGLQPDYSIDLEKVISAWDLDTSADPDSHKKGGITKTCFVFASEEGWAWTPYPGQGKKIGAMAQKISADLDVRYEEIACNEALATKLKETREACIPTILFGDPQSLQSGNFGSSLREYDGMYLPNCGTVVPWAEESKAAGDADASWKHLQDVVFHLKTSYPPPNHEWRSIFSQSELESKTRGMIDDLRSRLLGVICSEERAGGVRTTGPKVTKAENKELTELAAAEGIQTASAPQLEGPSK